VPFDLRVYDNESEAATAAARLVSEIARSAVAQRGTFTLAVSGGHTPWLMLAQLDGFAMPWSRCELYQVDERVAPHDDPDRNLAHLSGAIRDVPVRLHHMPVDDADLDAAAAAYADALPASLDLVHLGLGPDGHTASLVPGDPVLEVADKLVALTQEYQGRRRMTLTYPALARAAQVLWLVTGATKTNALRLLLAQDQSIPAGRVDAPNSIVIADRPAAG
jgi:6-phosphogluconolactonase